MKSLDKAANLAMLTDGATKCVDLWEGERTVFNACFYIYLIMYFHHLRHHLIHILYLMFSLIHIKYFIYYHLTNHVAMYLMLSFVRI